MADPFVLECSGLPAGLRVLAFEGFEEISTTYRYEIDLLADPDADLGDAVGAPATLKIRPETDQSTVVHGIIESATVVENLEDKDLYRVVLIPRVKEILGLDRHSRVFVRETVPSIVQTLLYEAGLRHDDCDFRLTRDYDPSEFVCQYRECTLDFLMRWMERDGIYFYFSQDGEKERMVITDDLRQHEEPRVQAPYLRSTGLIENDGLRRFRAERRAVPGRVHVDDYDYLRPVLPVRGEAVVQGGGSGELRVRGAKVTTPKDAERIAKLRAEGLRARQTVFHGEGRLHGIHAGELFTLSGHSRTSLDGDYLVTKLHVRGHHTGDLGPLMKELLGRDEPDDVLRTELVALWSKVQFRPELRTQPPRVYSMESGVVEGDSESDYAQLDEHGRYLVKFRFDERDGRGSRASARIRMMQPHAGSPEGMHFPLRKGTEVLIAFVGGDPDRPVIAGAVPNALNPAVVHGGNATKNVVHTGGGNRIVMEDSAGGQYVHIATPHHGSYIHIGATFNPQYNKVTNTTGTSLSYTQDISTSVTGTDAQTIVEDARVTVIGRSWMQPTDSTGHEIRALLGKSFIHPPGKDDDAEFEQENDDLVALIAADSAKALKDAAALTSATAGSPPSAAIAAVLAAIEALNSDMTTLAGDAASYQKAGLKPSDGYDVTAWQDAIQVAIAELKSLQTAVTPKLTGSPPVWPSPPTADFSGVPMVVDAVSAAVHAGPISFQKPAAGQPYLPSPNAIPQYIRLPHAAWHTTTLSATKVPTASPPSSSSKSPPAAETVDEYIQNKLTASPAGVHESLEKHDVTALDVLDEHAYPKVFKKTLDGKVPEPSMAVLRETGKAYALNSGSDVKIVGGDNVTIAANDARSHTLGHAYGLVQAGQTSVVYAPNVYPGAVSFAQGNEKAKKDAKDAEEAVKKAREALASTLTSISLREAVAVDVFGAIGTILGAVLSPAEIVAAVTLENVQKIIQALGNVPGAQGVIEKLDALLNALKAEKDAQEKLRHLRKHHVSRPSMPAPFPVGTIAQTSTAYGNTRSWVDGSTNGTVTRDATTTILGSKTSNIQGDTSSTVGGSVSTYIKHNKHTTIGDPGLVVDFIKDADNRAALLEYAAILGPVAIPLLSGSNVTTDIWGNRATMIIGTDSGLLLGMKTNVTIGASLSAMLGFNMDAFYGMKMSLHAGVSLTLNSVTELHQKVNHVKNALSDIQQVLMALHDNDMNLFNSEMNLLVSELHAIT